MKRALNIADGTEWDAKDLAREEGRLMSRQKPALVCLGCGGPVSLRVGSGVRTPCFAARHASDCDLLKGSWTAFRYLQ
jgi:competence CoiA-like predicted nuclease